ncbi:MAG TPA: TlpA disulfide reductase family protein [Gaiellales bacterium]|nr:TlpA disulfide reductase family protein [Gaiellales bacterium]
MGRKPYLAAIAAAVALIAGAVIYGRTHTTAVSAPMVVSATSISGRIPALSAPTLSGGRVSLAAARGKPMLINFFAYWCDPCNQEAPVLARLGRRFGSRITMLAVSTDPARAKTVAFAHRYGWNWPIVMDGSLAWSTAFQITGQPWTFLVNRNGEIVWKHPGAISAQAVTAAINRLLHT